jgi:hypothetical protein
MPDTPAYVADAKYDILAWNELATYFIGDLSGRPENERNVIRWTFGRVAGSAPWSDEETARFARATVADLRAAYARYPSDSGMRALVTEPDSGSSCIAPRRTRRRRKASAGWLWLVAARMAA